MSQVLEASMGYLKRKIDIFLLEWRKQPNRKPLIIKGARQIGKTESIRHFAKNNYESFIEINFVEEPQYKSIIGSGYKTDEIIKYISFLDSSKKFIPGRTLILFDELQECPNIATSLKFFCQDGRYDVICSGSLLGINYKQIESNSVGYKEDYEMFSMDFEEFLWAKGYADDLIEELFKHLCELSPIPEMLNKHLFNLFIDFCVLGGMPSIVKEYIVLNTFEKSLHNQRQIIADYKEDIRKYAEGLDQTRILNVFNHIPNQLAKENKKFQISKVAKGARFSEYRGCIEWLKDSGIINVCYCLNFPELPLSGNYEDTKCKLYMADNGLLVSMLDDETQLDLRSNKNLGVYKGALYENIIADALVKNKYPLFYYKREDSTLEEDFFIRSQNCLIPLEVKATNGKSKSLKTLINSDKYSDIKYGIKLINGNIGLENNILSMPYYCAFLLRRFISSTSFSDLESSLFHLT